MTDKAVETKIQEKLFEALYFIDPTIASEGVSVDIARLPDAAIPTIERAQATGQKDALAMGAPENIRSVSIRMQPERYACTLQTVLSKLLDRQLSASGGRVFFVGDPEQLNDIDQVTLNQSLRSALVNELATYKSIKPHEVYRMR